MPERRRSSRRKLPFLRSAILEADGSTHLAIVGDLSPEGAFLRTRLRLELGRQVSLRVVLPGEGRAVVLEAEVVWCGERFDPTSGHPAGLALRFKDVAPETRRRLVEFCDGAGHSPAPRPPIEYRVLLRPGLQEEELAGLGREGWMLAAAIPAPEGLRLVLWRKG